MRTNERGDKTRRRSLSRCVSITEGINHKNKEGKTNIKTMLRPLFGMPDMTFSRRKMFAVAMRTFALNKTAALVLYPDRSLSLLARYYFRSSNLS